MALIIHNIQYISGNLTDDPDLEFLPSGVAKAKMRIASTRKWTDKQGQTQERTVFKNIVAWRSLAENAAESFRKGDRVIVLGEERQDRWTDQQSGERKTWTYIEASDIGPSVLWNEVEVLRDRNRSRGSASSNSSKSSGPDNDPFTVDNDGDDDAPF